MQEDWVMAFTNNILLLIDNHQCQLTTDLSGSKKKKKKKKKKHAP